MKKPNLSKWENVADIEGLLFFAQSLEELLFHYTLDSYKAPALNAHASAWELVNIAYELGTKRIMQGSVQHVIDELEHHLANDPAIAYRESSIIRSLMNEIKANIGSIDCFQNLAESLLSEMGRLYWGLLRRKVVEAVADSRNKRQIIALATSLAVEIELRGFSKGYMYFEVEKFFFDPSSDPHKISSIDQAKDFLNLFEGDAREWIVVLRWSKDFSKFEEQAELFNIKVLKNIPEGIDPKILTIFNESKYPMYLIQERIESKDLYKCREEAIGIMDFFQMYVAFMTMNAVYIGIINLLLLILKPSLCITRNHHLAQCNGHQDAIYQPKLRQQRRLG